MSTIALPIPEGGDDVKKPKPKGGKKGGKGY